MKTIRLLLAIVISALLAPSTPVYGWGGKGHDVIAHIAQSHLTRRADREVTRLLDGRSMAYWSAWADGLRGDDRYDLLTTWHYANAAEGHTYASAPKNPAGDVYTAVEYCIEGLKDRGASDSLRALYVKLLIHFVGDMHCPMHAGRPDDRGGNDYPVLFRGSKSNLHRLWDGQIVDAARPWSALEWAVNLDHGTTRARRRTLSSGRPLDWMEQTVNLSHTLYAATPIYRPGDTTGNQSANTTGNLPIPRDYVTRHAPLLEQKFLEAGHRLAHLLNQLLP